MRCGKKKVWLDPNEINEIANTNSRMYILNEQLTFNFFFQFQFSVEHEKIVRMFLLIESIALFYSKIEFN